MPEFRVPAVKAGRQWRVKCGASPRQWSSSFRSNDATATQSAALCSAPNSKAAWRMNKNDEPQMAASHTWSLGRHMTGYAGGLPCKQALLQLEKSV